MKNTVYDKVVVSLLLILLYKRTYIQVHKVVIIDCDTNFKMPKT